MSGWRALRDGLVNVALLALIVGIAVAPVALVFLAGLIVGASL